MRAWLVCSFVVVVGCARASARPELIGTWKQASPVALTIEIGGDGSAGSVHAEQPVTDALAPGCRAWFASDGTYVSDGDTLTITFTSGALTQAGCEDGARDVVLTIPPFPDYDAVPITIEGSTLTIDGARFTRQP